MGWPMARANRELRRPRSMLESYFGNFASLPKFTFGKRQEEKTMDGFLLHTPRIGMDGLRGFFLQAYPQTTPPGYCLNH
ncbi:hypothetical protein DFAR_3480005 [Desulfarculales bacterium]